jgi:hypothetical protein
MLTALERAAIDVLVSGDDLAADPVTSQILKRQVSAIVAADREPTGDGIFIWLRLGPAAHVVPGRPRIVLSGVHASVDGLANGVGFVLFVEDGLLDLLEGFTYDEPWPQVVGEFTLQRVPAGQ